MSAGHRITVPELVKWAGLKFQCFGFVGSNPTCDIVPIAQLVRATVL